MYLISWIPVTPTSAPPQMTTDVPRLVETASLLTFNRCLFTPNDAAVHVAALQIQIRFDRKLRLKLRLISLGFSQHAPGKPRRLAGSGVNCF